MAVRLACARVSLCNLCTRAFQNNARSTMELHRNFVTDNMAQKPPKRPLSAFMLFMESKRTEIIQNNPGIKMQDVGRMAGEMFRNLENNEKEILKSQASERMKVWQQMYLGFKANLTKEQEKQLSEERKLKKSIKEKKRRRKELKLLGKPKRPLNAFFVYVRASQIERGDAPFPDFVKGLAEHWKLLPEQDKQMYQEEATRDTERYKRELQEWKERMLAEGREELISPKKPKKLKATKRKSVTTKKRTVKKTKKSTAKSKKPTKKKITTKRATKKTQVMDSSDSDD